MNHLKNETSPYLLQHADNPVAWYPWGEAAFERAREEDKPILLSIGYSACHWCHVMAHESFEDPQTAALMNELFINVKVDREERPDVDDIYMQVLQAMTGQGGWPLTMFLLPNGQPFYGGTYFPPESRFGMPAFRDVLTSVADTFKNRRAEVEEYTTAFQEALNEQDQRGRDGDLDDLTAELLDDAVKSAKSRFDAVNGGFGGAPKFPQPVTYDFLLRYYARTRDAEVLNILTTSLDKMARGGMYDQIGGGFHRYSVDEKWLVPHFEKMLYDNAQLGRLYLNAWQVTQTPFYRQIAEEIYDYVLREMNAPEGGFYSATDADSEGVEGKFFVWSRAEMETILGDDAALAIDYWGVTDGGNFEGTNILYLPQPHEEVAQRLAITSEELTAKITEIKHTLYAARTQRIQPSLDDKVISSWNGLMLASLAEAARVFEREDYYYAAVRCGEFLVEQLIRDERLLRTYKDDVAKLNGYLEDYAAVCEGLLQLYQTTFDERWFAQARELADVVLARFGAEDGGFYDTSDDHETLITRPRNLFDQAIPSGNSQMAKVLLLLAGYTGDNRYYEAAQNTIKSLSKLLAEHPSGFSGWLSAVDLWMQGLNEVAIIGAIDDPQTAALLATVQKPFRPYVIVALSPNDVAGESDVPLLSYRLRVGGKPTAYVCRNFACKLPVTTVDEVQALL